MGDGLSPLTRFGTSTWTYDGWQEQVYKRQYNKTALARSAEGILPVPLQGPAAVFRTVGNDSTFYRLHPQTSSHAI